MTAMAANSVEHEIRNAVEETIVSGLKIVNEDLKDLANVDDEDFEEVGGQSCLCKEADEGMAMTSRRDARSNEV